MFTLALPTAATKQDLPVVELVSVPGPSHLSEDGLVHFLLLPQLPHLSLRALPQDDLELLHLPIEKTPPAFPPGVESCKPDNELWEATGFGASKQKERFLCFFFFFKILCLYLREREHEQEEAQREKQTPR